MTNDAPTRVWVEPSYNAFGDRNWIEGFEGCGQEYIRADHAQAEKEAAVAAAYEDAADEVGQHLSTPEDVVWANDAAERIRDRSNTDALAARDAQVRAEALREAVEIVGGWHDNGNKPSDLVVMKAEADILALISTNQEENSND